MNKNEKIRRVLSLIGKPHQADAKAIEKALATWGDADLRTLADAKKQQDYKAMYNILSANGLNDDNAYMKALHDLADEHKQPHINQ